MSEKSKQPIPLIEQFLLEMQKEGDLKLEDDGSLIVKGILQRADAENQNGRIYPYKILYNAVEEYKKLIRENRAFGELDHRNEATVEMKTVCHMITDIWFEEKTVYGKVKIFPTDTGKNLITIIRCGGIPGISSRALGSIEKKGKIDVVQDDLKIYCWDFVSEPSTHGAFMKLSEAKEYNFNSANNDLVKEDTDNKISLLNESNNNPYGKINSIIDDILKVRKNK